MGRRSINTTKSGKYMNPTDQARKEARKKELKKNKRQRQMVRAAVLKGKDPVQILAEMEKIDQMEYNVLQPSPLNEKVLKDKRKKLRDTLDRVMKMYVKDDPDKWEELKRAEADYEKRRFTMSTYYEAVRHAQQVQVDDIPLPINQLPPESIAALAGLTAQIPLPVDLPLPLPPAAGILRKRSAYSPPLRPKIPPGVPPGPPPELDSEDEADLENIEEITRNRQRTIRFAEEGDSDSDSEDGDNLEGERSKNDDDDEDIDDEDDDHDDDDSDDDALKAAHDKMISVAGQDLDAFMKEIEEVQKKSEAGQMQIDSIGGAKLHHMLDTIQLPPTMIPLPVPPPSGQMPTQLPPAPPLGVPPPMMFRPPMMRLPMGLRLPPGPPPGRPPTLPPGPPPGLPPRLMGIRLPPGPPPRMAAAPTPNVVSAAPQLINRASKDDAKDGSQKGGATIEAKAQLRNLSADVTRFVPTALRVKRGDDKTQAKASTADIPSKPEATIQISKTQISKDDAYQQFMKEMEGLL
ncbi:WW domain-binding protein 11 isoform X2 [Nilaparvata lugens]|uniref:WW domain-binding protein 11 isoform X2 n=1 Tax=Nilaparvata lugens TaxID=108931 RepID=UPI00193E0D1C|nr:WW domain-binding protein 11 isoform X2 [Nilaparvata lugens]